MKHLKNATIETAILFKSRSKRRWQLEFENYAYQFSLPNSSLKVLHFIYLFFFLVFHVSQRFPYWSEYGGRESPGKIPPAS